MEKRSNLIRIVNSGHLFMSVFNCTPHMAPPTRNHYHAWPLLHAVTTMHGQPIHGHSYMQSLPCMASPYMATPTCSHYHAWPAHTWPLLHAVTTMHGQSHTWPLLHSYSHTWPLLHAVTTMHGQPIHGHSYMQSLPCMASPMHGQSHTRPLHMASFLPLTAAPSIWSCQ